MRPADKRNTRGNTIRLKRGTTALVIVFLMLFKSSVSVQGSILDLLQVPNNNEKILQTGQLELIVELEGAPAVRIASANSKEQGKQQEKANLQAQARVQNEISEASIGKIQAERLYTNVFNGFSIKVKDETEIEKSKIYPA